MAAWGGVGVAGGALARAAGGRELGRVPLAIACGVAGLAFGAVLDVYQWTLAARQDLPTYLAVSGTSLPYNLAHAIGNVAFCLLIGPALHPRAASLPAPVRGQLDGTGEAERGRGSRWSCGRVIAAAAVITSLTITSTERADAAASPTTKAARYLAAAQNRDGGFGGGKGQRSNQLFTGWAALGLAAAGRNPRDVARPRGRAITTYLRRAGSIRDTGELERTILVLKAAGLSPRRFGGRDLVADLMRRRRRDGSWQGNVAFTAFAVFALRAAGDPQESGSVQGAARYLERAQNGDGGFGFVPSAESDVDDTGAVLQALAAAGRRGGAVGRQGLRLSQGGPESRRRIGAERGAGVQRAVDGLGRSGPRGGSSVPTVARGGSDSLSAATPASRRPHLVLARQQPDAGVGDRPGADGPAAQAVPACHGAAEEAAGARRGRSRGAEGGSREGRTGPRPGRVCRGARC